MGAPGGWEPRGDTPSAAGTPRGLSAFPPPAAAVPVPVAMPGAIRGARPRSCRPCVPLPACRARGQPRLFPRYPGVSAATRSGPAPAAAGRTVPFGDGAVSPVPARAGSLRCQRGSEQGRIHPGLSRWVPSPPAWHGALQPWLLPPVPSALLAGHSHPRGAGVPGGAERAEPRDPRAPTGVSVQSLPWVQTRAGTCP